MALHDMPNPHLIDHENCLSWGMGSREAKQKNTNIFSIKLLGPLCHASWLGGYTPDLEESSFPFLAIAVNELTFKIILKKKKKLFSQSTPPAKEGPAIVKVTKSKHEGNIACNEAKCVAFMLYGNRYWWKASMQDMTGKHIASYRKSCSKKMNIMSDLQTSADMKWLLLIDCKLWLFILRRNKVHSMRCSPNPM